MKLEKIKNIRTEYSFESDLIKAKFSFKNLPFENIKEKLNLNEYLVVNSENVYVVRVSGDSMIGENIFDGDLLIVSSDEKPSDNKIIIASINGELAVKKLKIIDDKMYLISANEKFLPIEIMDYMEFAIEGVVKFVIHNVK